MSLSLRAVQMEAGKLQEENRCMTPKSSNTLMLQLTGIEHTEMWLLWQCQATVSARVTMGLIWTLAGWDASKTPAT